MDPLTHTLVGASLASTRLGGTTRLAAPALVIGANLPDVDVLSYVRGADFALGFRRGWTHGVPALIVLPLLLVALLWLWSRRWPPEERSKVSTGWLIALSYLALLTHPALDWLNTYGMRWWMPLSDTWYYGDSVFIMDPWLWLLLGVCWLLPKRPTRGLSITFVVLGGLLMLVVAGRAPQYLPVVGVVAALLLVAFVLRLPEKSEATHSLPTVGLAFGAIYIACMIWLQGVTEDRVRAIAVRDLPGALQTLMVGPMPANPLLWDVLLEDEEGYYRYGAFDWQDATLRLTDPRLRAVDPAWLDEKGNDQVPGFLRWRRFPWIEDQAPAPDGRIYVMDARYARERTTGFGGAVIESMPVEPTRPGR
jgi:inner membrane protein